MHPCDRHSAKGGEQADGGEGGDGQGAVVFARSLLDCTRVMESQKKGHDLRLRPRNFQQGPVY
jgi:hypothetical protein